MMILLACFPASIQALTLQEFSQLQKEQQLYYLMGALDTEIIDASLGPERSECVQNWGLKGAYEFLVNWYNRDPTDINNASINVALIVGLEAHKVCKYERIDPKSIKPLE